MWEGRKRSYAEGEGSPNNGVAQHDDSTQAARRCPCGAARPSINAHAIYKLRKLRARSLPHRERGGGRDDRLHKEYELNRKIC